MAKLTDMPTATRIGEGVYRVEHEGRQVIVYVAGIAGDCWAFSNGRVFKTTSAGGSGRAGHDRRSAQGPQALAAPMPATVVKVLVEPGMSVRKGDTVILLEAMKMELPLRAPSDAIVTAVHCRQGELVQPDVTLIELS